jgi:hypothetical protein
MVQPHNPLSICQHKMDDAVQGETYYWLQQFPHILPRHVRPPCKGPQRASRETDCADDGDGDASGDVTRLVVEVRIVVGVIRAEDEVHLRGALSQVPKPGWHPRTAVQDKMVLPHLRSL